MHVFRLLGMALAMVQSPAPSGVTDGAKMFSEAAVKQAGDSLAEIRKETGWQVVVTTVDTLGGKKIADEAHRRAEEANVRGLYILLSKKESNLFAVPTPGNLFAVPTPVSAGPFSKEKIDAIVGAFTTNFKKNQFDQGLTDAITEIRKAAVTSRAAVEVVGVRDGAKMFSSSAVIKADELLLKLHHDANSQVLIQTVDSLEGQNLNLRAENLARSSNLRGLLILIAKKEQKLYLLASKSAESVFTKDKRAAIQKTIEIGFRAKEFDKALIEAAEQARDIVRPMANQPKPTATVATAPKDVVPTPPSPPEHIPLAIGDPLGSEMPDGTPIPRRNVQAPAKGVKSEMGDVKTASTEVKTVPKSSDVAPPVSPLIAVQSEEPKSPPYLLYAAIGGGVLIGLWILSRAFRGSSAPATQPGYAANQAPQPGYAPQSRPVPPPGYAPAPPPGYAPMPPPGYGPGGYGPPPQQGGGGGGLVTGVLGGLGGAVIGNILYDKFGRPHPEGHVQHDQSSQAPPTTPTRETSDPNSGVEGSWAEPPAPGAPAGNDWVGGSGNGGDWASPEPVATPDGSEGSWGEPAADPGTGGGWGEPEPEQPPAQDWSAPADQGGGGGWDSGPAPDTGGAGGDWGGGGDTPQPEQGQEGGW